MSVANRVGAAFGVRDRAELFACAKQALQQSPNATTNLSAWRENVGNHIASFTARPYQITKRGLDGNSGKNTAADLGISRRIV